MIVVTGGAGFIGSNIVGRLCAQGSEVVVCDWLGSDNIKWKNLAKHPIDRVVAPEALDAYLAAYGKDVTAIVHMGAISATTASDADLVVRSNFDLSRMLWEWCAAHTVPFVYASSAATYGDGDQGFSDDNALERHMALRPLNLYGWSKKWFDVWALGQVEKGRPAPPQWAGLKFFNVYGPNELHKLDMMSVVAKASGKCARGEVVELFKSHHPGFVDGGQLRDFVYVDDVVDVISWLLKMPGVNGIYNLGSGAARSFLDLISTAFRAAGHEPNIRYIDMPLSIRDKYQYFTQADMTRLRQAGYNAPMTSLEVGVTRYMQDYLLTSDPFR
jgi:ADP-L-glycero-D-manno-heptose 6-epimerase